MYFYSENETQHLKEKGPQVILMQWWSAKKVSARGQSTGEPTLPLGPKLRGTNIKALNKLGKNTEHTR